MYAFVILWYFVMNCVEMPSFVLQGSKGFQTNVTFKFFVICFMSWCYMCFKLLLSFVPWPTIVTLGISWLLHLQRFCGKIGMWYLYEFPPFSSLWLIQKSQQDDFWKVLKTFYRICNDSEGHYDGLQDLISLLDTFAVSVNSCILDRIVFWVKCSPPSWVNNESITY